MSKHTFRFALILGLITFAMMLGACGNKNDSGTSPDKASSTDPDLADQVALDNDIVDSLFKELLLIADDVANKQSLVDYKSYELQELAEAFEPYVATGNAKANIGFITAEMTSLNSSKSIQEIVDGIDTYLYGESVDASAPKKFIAKSYENNGLNGLSSALLAKTPDILIKQSTASSFPEFITISHIQDIINDEINPRLNNIIAALEYIEATDINQSLLINIFGEEWELDGADIYLLDATIHSLRASLKIITAYNFDMYDPTTKTNSWIDSLVQYSSDSYYTYNTITRGDTTIDQYHYQTFSDAQGKYLHKFIKYNMERSEFLTIKQANHAQAYADLLKVPEKLNKAIDLLEAETDSQENDIIKKVDFDAFKSELAYFEEYMLSAGFSADFASRFRTPKTLVAFVEELLTKPYTLSITDDFGSGEATIDISKFFTSPIKDLKSILPKYQFRSEDNIFETLTYSSFYSNYDGTYSGYEDIEVLLVIFDFLDDKGNVYYYDDVFFPYFDDYTVNGIFPNMTREKWIDFVQAF